MVQPKKKNNNKFINFEWETHKYIILELINLFGNSLLQWVNFGSICYIHPTNDPNYFF